MKAWHWALIIGGAFLAGGGLAKQLATPPTRAPTPPLRDATTPYDDGTLVGSDLPFGPAPNATGRNPDVPDDVYGPTLPDGSLWTGQAG